MSNSSIKSLVYNAQGNFQTKIDEKAQHEDAEMKRRSASLRREQM